jgi:hypothetical protein
MRISGKVMATAALNSRNAGFSIIVTRLLRSMTTNWPTWATANKPPAITAIGPAWVLSGDSDTRISLEEIPPVGGSSRSTPTLATARAKRKGCAIVEQNPTLGNHRRMKERWRFTLRHIQPGVRWGGEARCSRRWIPTPSTPGDRRRILERRSQHSRRSPISARMRVGYGTRVMAWRARRPQNGVSEQKIRPCEQRQLLASAGCGTINQANLGASLIRHLSAAIVVITVR